MRYRRLIFFGFVLFLCFTAFLSSQSPDQKTKKTEEKPPPPELIRKDLLVFENAELKPPKRNIFTPQSTGIQNPEDFEEQFERERAEQLEVDAMVQEEAALQSLGIRYIGYVKSPRKITALILFEGEALAVNEGEEIAVGVTVSSITLEDIEVIGPDQKPRKFPLEGETP